MRQLVDFKMCDSFVKLKKKCVIWMMNDECGNKKYFTSYLNILEDINYNTYFIKIA